MTTNQTMYFKRNMKKKSIKTGLKIEIKNFGFLSNYDPLILYIVP
jgi:hypothetical protein